MAKRALPFLVTVGLLIAFLPLANAPAAEQNHGRIVFSSNRGDGTYYNLYAVDPDGQNLSRLDNVQAFDLNAAWSPDGATIAFARFGDVGNEDVYLMNADGSNVRQLTSGNGDNYQPAWTQDGHRIAFTSSRTGHPEIFVMDADGSHQTQVTSTPDPELNHRAAWLDGDKLVYGHAPDATTFEGPFTLLTIHRNGKDQGDVTPADVVAPDGVDVTHRNGDRMAFVDNFCSICDVSDVFTMKVGGQDLRQLTSDFGNNLDPSWSPDGRAIAFSHEDAPITFDHEEIYTMSDDGSHLFNVTHDPADDVDPTWGCPGKSACTH